MVTVTKAIFWDNDGVLVDTERLYFLATQQVLAGVGIELSEQQYIELFLVQGAGAWHLAAERGVSSDAIAELRKARNSLYSTFLRQEPLLNPGVRAVLDVLHSKYVMGIVTSSERDHFSIIHESTGLLPYFEFVIASGDYTYSKPHPEPYLRAVERSGCRKEECLVIEDSQRGFMAAHAAGLRCIVVPSGFTRRSDFTGAYKVLGNIGEVLAVLESDLTVALSQQPPPYPAE